MGAEMIFPTDSKTGRAITRQYKKAGFSDKDMENIEKIGTVGVFVGVFILVCYRLFS